MEFWSVEYLATMAGAVAATKILTTVICNYWEGASPKYVAGGVALAVQIFVWLSQIAAGAALDWVALALAVFNAALVYLGAVGTNAIMASQIEQVRAVEQPGRGSARWF